jgi:Mn-dependent DtxR family transcriptional regulator
MITMDNRDLSESDMIEIQQDLDQLIRLGLVTVDGSGGLVLTEAGEDAIHKTNAQTWN